MGRKRPETKLNQISKMLIEEYQPQSIQDIQDAIKSLLGDTLESMLKAELDEFRLWIWWNTFKFKY